MNRENCSDNLLPNPSGNVAEKKPRLLVHMCCGPCSIYPLRRILADRMDVWGLFYNPNIHPLAEFRRRLEAVRELARFMSISVLFFDDYRPSEFVKGIKAIEDTTKHPPRDRRCRYCYSSRLELTAMVAKERGFDAFSTSLLYSRRQNHQLIKEIGIELSQKYGILFYYQDFREGWKEGIVESRRLGLYRQNYCGCIYSRIERFSGGNSRGSAGSLDRDNR